MLLILRCSTVHAQGYSRALIDKYAAINTCAPDTEAAALVLFEKKTVVIYTEDHYLRAKQVTHKVIKIFKPQAASLADVQLFLAPGDVDRFVGVITGSTYNKNGDIVYEEPLNKADIKTKKAKNGVEVDFTLPLVKVGSVIDYSYESLPDNFNWTTISWEIQDDFPKLVSEFEIRFHSTLDFTSICNVREPVSDCNTVEEAEASPAGFTTVKQHIANDQRTSSSTWVKKYVSRFQKEPYVINPENYRERIDIQLTHGAFLGVEEYEIDSWEKLNKKYWKDDHCGKEITAPNHYLDNTVAAIIKDIPDAKARAKAIFGYVRTHFTENPDKKFIFKRSLESVFNDKEGNYIEINLLLAAMLVHAGIDASPVLLGTIDEPSPVSAFPVTERLNYLVCAATIDSNIVLLDATRRTNCYGLLPPDCYNGFAWKLGSEGQGIDLSPALVVSKELFAVKIYDVTDTTAKLQITSKPGLPASQATREEKDSLQSAIGEFREQLLKMLPATTVIDSIIADNFQNPDTNLVFHASCTMHRDKNADFSINAILYHFFNQNPIKPQGRKLPFEFPCRREENYFMSITLPPGMIPDTTSKPIKISYGSSEMSFKKSITYYESMHTLSVNAAFTVTNTVYPKESAAPLRDFFQQVIDANKEVITFKTAAKN